MWSGNIEVSFCSGQFAVVKKVIEKETGTEYAAKFMKKKRTKSRRSRGVTVEQITQEAGVLREVRHEGVIYLHDVFEAAQEYVLVLELWVRYLRTQVFIFGNVGAAIWRV